MIAQKEEGIGVGYKRQTTTQKLIHSSFFTFDDKQRKQRAQ